MDNTNAVNGLTEKQQVLEGLYETAEIVASSLGPLGRKVLMVRSGKDSIPMISQDGVNIARQLPGKFLNPFQRAGSQLLVDAAQKTVDAAGDGTTTTCILARELIQRTEESPVTIVPELKAVAELAIEQVMEASREPSKDELTKMAVVSARTRPEVGTMIADLIWQIGGKAHVQGVPDTTTFTEVKRGYEIDTASFLPVFWRWQGKSPYIQTNRDSILLKNPLVVIVEEKVTSQTDLIKFLERYETQSMGWLRPLVLLISDLDDKALVTFSQNFAQPQKIEGQMRYLPVFPIKAPGHGMDRIEMLRDIDSGVGAGVYSKYTSKKFKNFDGHFGEAESITIYRDSTHFLFQDRFEDKLNKRAKEVNDEKRHSQLTSGVGIIHIGGYTDVERTELGEVVEDVVRASQAAMEFGVVPGAGSTFLNVELPDTEAGIIMMKALEGVFRQLTKDLNYIYRVVSKKKLTEQEKWDKQIIAAKNKGVLNLHTQAFESPEDTAIFDSCKSLTEAIANSVSLACELLATNHTVKC
jgi:chaperonin GroEL